MTKRHRPMKPFRVPASLVTTVAIMLTTDAVVSAATNLAIPAPNEIIARLRPEHPRLLAHASDFAQLRQRVSADTQLKAWHAELRREAAKIIAESPSKYEIP